MKYSFSEEQKNFIRQLGFSPEQDYDDDSTDELLDMVADYLMTHGFDKDYEHTNHVGDGTDCGRRLPAVG